MKFAFLSLVVCFFLFSCKKHTQDAGLYWPCDIIEDSAAISSQIIGSWKWAKYSCATDKIIVADKDTKVVFNSDGTFILQGNSTAIAEGNWHLKRIDISGWGLDLTSPTDYLKGYTIFCENQVAFIDSYEDGCNYYFAKTN